jgi:hypothetical protein
VSANFTTPGQAYDHLLNPLKGFHPDWAVDVRGKLHTTVDLTVVTPHSGRVVHIAATVTRPNAFTGRGPHLPAFSMGCGAVRKGPPIWLWSGVYEPDISNKGTPSGVATTGAANYPPNWLSSMPGRDPTNSEQVWGLVGIPGLEVETTEYDTAQTYLPGEHLRAVTLDNNVNGGVVTNQNASSGAALATTTNAFTLLTDTVVGIVSRGTYKNSNDRQVLSLYTFFLPGTR